MKSEFTGRHMAAVLVGGFGIVIAVNLSMATLADPRLWRRGGRELLRRQPEIQRLAGRSAARRRHWAGIGPDGAAG